ncbi:hypothetical protein KL949_000644 [Ogataea haglerorum]|nr:hypothetical protein KL913_000122 [Ogataea haglerorum]KAG7723594.1 hypothetical protein KL949_000644 [Ogataea haglerorum]KAG7771782.1 hypothetical protein KL931_000122 [Ogataea haglerorum]
MRATRALLLLGDRLAAYGSTVCSSSSRGSAKEALLGALDDGVDDIILERVHDEREYEDHEGDLEIRHRVRPGEQPVRNVDQERAHDKQDVDYELHGHESDEIECELLEIVRVPWRIAVLPRLDALDSCVSGESKNNMQQAPEDRDADGCVEKDIEEVVVARIVEVWFWVWRRGRRAWACWSGKIVPRRLAW